ncbi:hypothetical protein BJY22_002895 [Kribbella shirazensis]|uniref:Uncharacterized protein n=1 Tax=Kribbella shirazensis TaxID=1105143 RepID=A0A7X5V9Q7_9ACTN|nr:hypothetical protein [Kribbella shirazensis]
MEFEQDVDRVLDMRGPVRHPAPGRLFVGAGRARLGGADK